MPAKTFHIQEANYAPLLEVDNMSGLINSLLAAYFSNNKTPVHIVEEYKTVKEAYDTIKAEYEKMINKQAGEQRMREQEESNKKAKEEEEKRMKDFFSDWGDNEAKQTEYKQGVKDGLWRNTHDYARIKLS